MLRKKNVSEQIQKHFCFPGSKFCFRNKCFLEPQTGKHLLPQQCFCNIVSLFANALKLPNREFKKGRRLRQRQRQKAVILLVKRIKMLVLHVRHAFLNISLPYSSKLLREITKFKVLTTTWTNYRESFSFTLYFKSVCTNPVLGHFTHIE